MFDHVRIRASPATVAAGVAGRDGQVHGFTAPSVTGVEVIIGDLRDDLAYNVHLPDRDESFWFAPDLLELLDRAEGSEIRLDGVPKWHWRRVAASPPRLGALLTALWTAVYLYRRFGLPPLDPWDIGAGMAVVCFAAGLGAGLGLAYSRGWRSSAALRRTAVVLAALSLWVFWSFELERRAVPRMLASADSVNAVVLGWNVSGNLLLYFPHRGGRGIAPRKHAHAGFTGDSITVYLDPEPPHPVLDVWPPGPDLRVTLERLAWLWVLGVAGLAGWVPELVRWFRGPEHGRQPDR